VNSIRDVGCGLSRGVDALSIGRLGKTAPRTGGVRQTGNDGSTVAQKTETLYKLDGPIKRRWSPFL